MSVKISDVAKAAGVSNATVSRAFSNKDLVKEKTLRKIHDAAKKLNYSPNAMARAMKTNKTGNIGLIFSSKQKPIVLNPFYSGILEAVRKAVNQYGYTLIIASDQELRGSIGHVGLQSKIDGVILAGELGEEIVKVFKQVNIPVVLLNHYLEQEDLHCVISDDYRGAYDAVKHLVDQGHYRIGMIAGRYNPFICEQRYRAYRRVLEDSGIAFQESYVSHVEPKFEDVHKVVTGLLSMEKRPTALFCNGDVIAIYGMKSLLRQGIKIPEEMAIIGFDDNDYCVAVEPELSSVHVNREKMGEVAMHILHNLMTGKEISKEKRLVITETKLIARTSTSHTK